MIKYPVLNALFALPSVKPLSLSSNRNLGILYICLLYSLKLEILTYTLDQKGKSSDRTRVAFTTGSCSLMKVLSKEEGDENSSILQYCEFWGILFSTHNMPIGMCQNECQMPGTTVSFKKLGSAPPFGNCV